MANDASKAPYCMRTTIDKETINDFLITAVPQEAADPNETFRKDRLIQII